MGIFWETTPINAYSVSSFLNSVNHPKGWFF